VPGLFARNERVVCEFDGPHGRFVLTLVGATIVGSMATVWHGLVNPPRPGRIQRWDYQDQQIVIRKGEEMGASSWAPPWCCCSRQAAAF
jgi:phosphatidylserine decarboxylase